jgi:hypothetical protein
MGEAQTSKRLPAAVPNNMHSCVVSTEQFQESRLTDGNREMLVTTRDSTH